MPLSPDSTLRSNLSVGMPLDLAVIGRDALRVTRKRRIKAGDPALRAMSEACSTALREAFQRIAIRGLASGQGCPTFAASMEVAMPELVRLYIRSVAIGFAVAVAFTGGLLWLDVAGLGGLVLGSDIGWLAALLLVFFNGIVFAAVQFGLAVMAMADRDGPEGGHGARAPVPFPTLLPAPALLPAPLQRRDRRRGGPIAEARVPLGARGRFNPLESESP